MGRRAEGLCPAWGSPGRSSPWQAALLAASILSSGFLPTEALVIIEITVKPSQTLLLGQNATLTPGGTANLFSCEWFRGEEEAGAKRIFKYLPPPDPEQQNGPSFTGRETAGPGCTLHIQNVTLSDNGNYTVSKTVKGGDAETGRVQIEVLENLTKPDVSAFPSPFPIEFTGSVNLTCETSSKKATISWLYNDKPLGSSPRIQVSEDNRTVTISSAIRNDTGFYQCEVSNVFSTSTSDSMYIAVIYGPDTPEIYPTERFYNEHSEVRLSCNASAFPDARYIWSFNGEKVGTKSEFVIPNITLENSGNYVCLALNVLSHQSSSTALEIEVVGGTYNITISGPSTAIEYHPVSLSCTSLGSDVSYYWFKGNQTVEVGDRVVLADNNQTLQFLYSHRNDTASYVCQRINSFSTVFSEPHRLEILYGPESPIIDPQESVYLEGSTLNLSCFAISNPPAKYSWWFDDQLLEDQKDSQLLIWNLSRTNAGNYTCNATNDYTGNSSTTTLEIRILERVSNVTIISHPEKAIENQPTVLSCSSAGSSVSYRWSKGNQPLESGGHISLSNSNLTFNPTYRNDSGNYTCYGNNSLSDSSTIFLLDVLYGPDEPVISPPGHDYANGSLLTLSCHADSHPPAQYTWYFNETELMKDPNLPIPSLSFDQAGNYTCEASNHETKLSRSLSWEINVLEEVSNVTIQGPSETTENGSVTLSCISNGSKVSYTWFRENQRLEDGGHISLLGPSHEKLTLNPVNRSDAGSYTCRGVNSVSSDTSNSFRLDVLYGPDDPIISPPEHDYIEGSNLNLSCRADSSPVPQYTWLFNETEEVGNSSQLLISDLSFEKAGNYICRATNQKTSTSRAAAHEIRVLEKLSPPVLWPKESTVKEHANVTLNCTISASSTVTVSWFKDGKPVPAKAVISEQNRILLVPDISKEDEGTYTCVASNRANDATSNPSKIIVESATPTPGGGGLSPGAIVGIVIGCLVGVVLIVAVLYFVFRGTSSGRMEQHSSNGNVPSAPGRNQGVTDTKPKAGEEDIQYTTLAFGSSRPQPDLRPTSPSESSTVYVEIKKK